jgi:beta-1,3-glucuronyltransferase
MPYKPGFEEDGFLKSLAPFEPKEIELKAKDCTEVSIIVVVKRKEKNSKKKRKEKKKKV